MHQLYMKQHIKSYGMAWTLLTSLHLLMFLAPLTTAPPSIHVLHPPPGYISPRGETVVVKCEVDSWQKSTEHLGWRVSVGVDGISGGVFDVMTRCGALM
jgi:hypothetical protein